MSSSLNRRTNSSRVAWTVATLCNRTRIARSAESLASVSRPALNAFQTLFVRVSSLITSVPGTRFVQRPHPPERTMLCNSDRAVAPTKRKCDLAIVKPYQPQLHDDALVLGERVEH